MLSDKNCAVHQKLTEMAEADPKMKGYARKFKRMDTYSKTLPLFDQINFVLLHNLLSHDMAGMIREANLSRESVVELLKGLECTILSNIDFDSSTKAEQLTSYLCEGCGNENCRHYEKKEAEEDSLHEVCLPGRSALLN